MFLLVTFLVVGKKYLKRRNRRVEGFGFGFGLVLTHGFKGMEVGIERRLLVTEHLNSGEDNGQEVRQGV